MQWVILGHTLIPKDRSDSQPNWTLKVDTLWYFNFLLKRFWVIYMCQTVMLLEKYDLHQSCVNNVNPFLVMGGAFSSLVKQLPTTWIHVEVHLCSITTIKQYSACLPVSKANSRWDQSYDQETVNSRQGQNEEEAAWEDYASSDEYEPVTIPHSLPSSYRDKQRTYDTSSINLRQHTNKPFQKVTAFLNV